MTLAALFVSAAFGCSSGEADDARLGRTTQALTSLTTDQPAYSLPAAVTVSWSGLPGNVRDWIAIAPQGAPNASYGGWTYTNGDVNGSFRFTIASGGTYVARAFENDGFTLLGESAPFVVSVAAPTTITTNASSYGVGSPIVIDFTNAAGTVTDWVALAPQGSPPATYDRWAYTDGSVNGQVTLSSTDLALGTYVARIFHQNSLTIAAESAPFSVTLPPLTTDKSSYAAGETVTVSFVSLPGDPNDWLSVAAPGSDPSSYTSWQYTNGQASGSAMFAGLPNGLYVARAFHDDGMTVIRESAPFLVGGLPVRAAKPSYGSGESVTVKFAQLPGNATDWVALATPGSAASSYVTWTYTGGVASGSIPFPGVADGTYVVRSFVNNGFVIAGESASFTVGLAPSTEALSTNASSYTSGQDVTVSFAGFPGNAPEWVAIATQGSDPSSYVAWSYTGGVTSGTLVFSNLAVGTFVVRAYFANGNVVEYESAPFTIAPM